MSAMLAFGEPTGQSWTQIGELAVAFGLSLIIGIEREAKQKSAGMRTYSLVGLGSALFVLISKYGFSDVLGTDTILDPSRVAAQIVTGVGFIGGGLIFVRRDAVRGLTTAASVWLVAAVGAAAGAGLPVLAAFVTALYFVVVLGLRPLSRVVRRRPSDGLGLRISYLDGRGLLREIVSQVTGHGFSIAQLTTAAAAADGESPNPGDAGPTVTVTMLLTGRLDPAELTAALAGVDGIVDIRTGATDPEE